MHRRRIELMLDALEVIEPLDGVVEFGAFLLGELGFHFRDRLGELGAVELLRRGRDVGQHGKTLLVHFGEAAKHDDLLVAAAVGGDGQDARPDRGHHRRVAGEHAQITLHAGDVDLIDLAGEGEFFRGDEIEVESGHGIVLRMASGEWRVVRKEMASNYSPLPIRYSPSYAASAASFLPFSTASSMVPTMKKACSGRWSYLPSQMARKPLMVSARSTNLPGE